VGTDIHVTQGGVELESVEWDDRRNALRVTERSPVREFARLFFRVPGGFKLTGGRGPEGMVIDPPGPDGIMMASYRARGAAETVIEFNRG
jgi:hypothetical protein